MPPSALVFVGGVQARVLAVSAWFDVAQVQLPEQQSVCGASGYDGNSSSAAGQECGMQAILIVPPPLRSPDGSAHLSMEWPPVLDNDNVEPSGSASDSSEPIETGRRALQQENSTSRLSGESNLPLV